MTRELTEEEAIVFGADAKVDPKTNRPIEQGIGSAHQPTIHSAEAHLRALEAELMREQSMGFEVQDDLRAQVLAARKRVADFKAAAGPPRQPV